MRSLALTPEMIQNPKGEDFVISRLNNEKALADANLRMERLQLVAFYNVILAAKCIQHCFLPQKNEINFLRDFAQKQAYHFETPDLSAEAFIALSRIGSWHLLGEIYFFMKDLPAERRKQITPSYLKYLKYNGFEKEQTYLFTMLINLAADQAEAEKFFYEMEMQQVELHLFTYNSLIAKAESFERATFWFQKAKIAGYEPDQVSYATLIHKATTSEQVKAIFGEMKTEKLQLDEITYSTLINKSQTFAQAKQFFKEMKEANLKPNEVSYSTLINKATDFSLQKPFYSEFLRLFPLKKGNSKSEKNYNFLFTALFKKVKNKEDFSFMQSEIYRLGLKLDDYTQSFYDTLKKRFG